jgi:hypothetical protein
MPGQCGQPFFIRTHSYQGLVIENPGFLRNNGAGVAGFAAHGTPASGKRAFEPQCQPGREALHPRPGP